MKSVVLSSMIFLGTVMQLHAAASTEQINKQVIDAYVYGFPLVLMDITKDVLTDTSKVTSTKAPINQFVFKRIFPDPSFTEVVSPNADTLYSQAWIDVKKEPVILSVPNMGDRYYLFPMLDMWTNVFFSPGTRTTGNGPNHFAITGPEWKGALPKGVEEVKSPTNSLWLIGRIQTNGSSDFATVNKLQDQYKLTLLHDWNTRYTSPASVLVNSHVDSKLAPIDQVLKMDGITFFKKLSTLLKTISIPVQDLGHVKEFSKFGLIPGQNFDANTLSPQQTKALNESVKNAQLQIKNTWTKHPFATTENGWGVIRTGIGNYGTDYDMRAAVAYGGLGANLPEDAIYPVTNVDSTGQPLNGKFSYVIHFDKNALPPVKAFWSITMYNERHFFIPNSLKRYAIGDRDKLKFNADGSLDIYIQNSAPKEAQKANWLPSPKDNFNLMLRLYQPGSEILNGAWKPPAVKKIKSL